MSNGTDVAMPGGEGGEIDSVASFAFGAVVPLDDEKHE